MSRAPIINAIFSFIAVAQLRGDPHITTIDGVAYTFNGHGEFILLETTADSNKFIVQVCIMWNLLHLIDSVFYTLCKSSELWFNSCHRKHLFLVILSIKIDVQGRTGRVNGTGMATVFTGFVGQLGNGTRAQFSFTDDFSDVGKLLLFGLSSV